MMVTLTVRIVLIRDESGAEVSSVHVPIVFERSIRFGFVDLNLI